MGGAYETGYNVQSCTQKRYIQHANTLYREELMLCYAYAYEHTFHQ